jgi:hypothetical protein
MSVKLLRAIQTKFLPSTLKSPARIKAFDCSGNCITCPCDSGDWLDVESHRLAAETLREKLQWKGELIGGHIKGGGMVFVLRAEE